MMKTICGADCNTCMIKSSCQGCTETGGHPFGKECLLAACARKKKLADCGKCTVCSLRESLIRQFNSLGIEDMEPLSALYALKGAFINMTYKLPGGQPARFWDDDKIYLGSQLRKGNSPYCYGLAADEKYLMVCQYRQDGTETEIIVFKKWN